MRKEDIERLATLARIELKEEEITAFTEEISSILGYVSEINDITENETEEKTVGAVYNVMREDIPSHEPGAFTDDLLNAAPLRDGQYVKVKKILQDS